MTEVNILLSAYLDTRQVVKNGQSMSIDVDIWQEHVLDKIPEIWNSEYDQLETFVYASDGSYRCKKLKRVPDKDNPGEYIWKIYTWYELPELDAKEVYKIFRSGWERQVEVNFEKEQKQLEEGYKSYEATLAENVYQYRSIILSHSDWMFTTDSQVSEKTKNMWLKYRQALRDVPQKNVEVKDKLDWLFPVDPDMYLSKEKELTETFASGDEEKIAEANAYLEKVGYAPGTAYLEDPKNHYVKYRYLRGLYDCAAGLTKSYQELMGILPASSPE